MTTCRDKYKWYATTDLGPNAQGPFALRKIGEDSYWTSHSGKTWYKGTMGSAIAAILRSFFRLGEQDLILNYEVINLDSNESVAEFCERGDDEIAIDERSRAEKILEYSYAWQHCTTGKYWISPLRNPDVSDPRWYRQRCNIVMAYKAADRQGFEVPSVEELKTEWFQIRRHEGRGFQEIQGPVLADKSLPKLSEITISLEIRQAVVALMKRGESKANILKRLEVR